MGGLEIAGYLLSALLVLIGLAGSVLPALPGLPLMLAGFALAAWIGDFVHLGLPSLLALAVIAAIGVLIDFVSGFLGARASGASGKAQWGAFLGGLAGLPLGLPGIVFGPLVGAVIGELITRRDAIQAGKVGIGAFLGFLAGAVAKVICAFAMLATAMVAFITG